jgi:hypothetical protein
VRLSFGSPWTLTRFVPMHNDYRIEKQRQPVVVVMATGDRLFGDIFVQAYARHRSGREEPMDVLNDPEPFFPLAMPDGGTLLIAKQCVRELEVVGTLTGEDLTAVAAQSTAVELTLAGGHTRAGWLYLEVPFDRPRLLDFLNRFDQRFLTLHTDDGVRLVNIRSLERARQLD